MSHRHTQGLHSTQSHSVLFALLEEGTATENLGDPGDKGTAGPSYLLIIKPVCIFLFVILKNF